MSIMDLIREGKQWATEAAGKRLEGLRGQAAAPAAPTPEPAATATEPAAPKTASGVDYEARRAAAAAKAQAEMAANASTSAKEGAQVARWNEVSGQRFGPAAQPQTTGSGAVAVRDPSVRGAGPVYEGSATRVPGAPSFAPASGGGAGGIGGISGGANGVPGVQPPSSGGTPVTPEATAKPGLMSTAGKIGGGLLRGAGALQAAYGVKQASEGKWGDAVDNMVNGAVSTVAPGVGVIGNIAAGLRNAAIQWGVDRAMPTHSPWMTQQTKDAMAAYGMEDGRGHSTTPLQAPATTGTQTEVQEPIDPRVRTNQGLRTPGQVIAGNAVPLPGEGAFQVGKNPAQGIRTALPTPAAAPAMGRVGTGIASLANGVIGSRLMENQYTKELNAAKIAATAGTTARAIAKDTAATHDQSIDTHVRSTAPEPTMVSDGIGKTKVDPLHKEMIDRRKAELKGDIEFTVNQHGQRYDELKPHELQRLLLLDKMKRRVAEERKTGRSRFRDYWGMSRTDSRDLYSYKPAIKSLAILPGGGEVVTLANGNQITTNGVSGGGFRLFAPNDVVDADMERLMNHSIEQFKKDRHAAAQAAAKAGEKK